MKKLISVLMVIILAVSTSFGAVTASAVGGTTGEVNVIFLVDSSLSMRKSDPDMIRLEAIKLFADLCILGKTKIGFTLFGSDIIYDQQPIAINTEADRDALKKKVDELTELKGSTDIGLALRHTVESFAADGSSGNGRFIVFLSDGRTMIPKSVTDRTTEDSEKDLEKGIEAARAAGIPIYTIGLNASGEVDEEQLHHISAETFADETYMTNSAGDLSEILSDIYVRHTGAENKQLASFTSIGGTHDTEFQIADSTVIEANLVIMHSEKLDDIKITDPDGTEAMFDGTQADISTSEGHTLVKIYDPRPGSWHIYVASPSDTRIDINYILTRDFSLDLELSTDKAVAAGTKVKITAVLTDPNGEAVTDEVLLGNFAGKAILKNEATGEAEEIPLSRDEKGDFGAEGKFASDDNYTLQAILYNSNVEIRSNIVMLENGSETYKEPEGPLKIILICVGAAVLLVIVIMLIIKHLKENIRMFSGKLVITVNAGGIPSMPLSYDFAKRIPGKRKVMLSKVLKDLSDDPAVTDAVPASVTSAVAITMNSTGELRVSGIKGVEYSGGVTVGKNVVLSNANRLTLRYTDKGAGSNNLLIIQYLRT